MHEQKLASSVIWLGQCICPTRPCGHAQPNVSRPGLATPLFMRGPVNKKPIRVALASCRKLRTNLNAVLKVWMETTPMAKIPERITLQYSLLSILIARCRKRDYMTYGKDAIQRRPGNHLRMAHYCSPCSPSRSLKVKVCRSAI